MITNQDFKKDFFEATLNVTKKTFIPMIVYTFIMYAVVLAILIPTVFMKLGLDITFFKEYLSLGIMERNDFLQQYLFKGDIPGFGFVRNMLGYIFLSLILFGIVLSWVYNLKFIFIAQYMKSGSLDFIGSVKKSFTPKVFTIFFMLVLVTIIFVVVEVLFIFPLFLLSSIHISLVFIGGFLVVVFLLALMLRFILAIPHIIKSNASVVESLSYSFNQITLKKSFKYLAIFIVAYIAIIIVSLLLYSLKSIGTVGVVLSSIIQFGLGGFISAMSIATILGLYSLYSEEEFPEVVDDLEHSLEIEDKFENFR